MSKSKPTQLEILYARLEAERFFRDTFNAAAKIAVERMYNDESLDNPIDHMVQAFEDVLDALVENGILQTDTPIENGGNDDEDKGYN